MFYEQDLVFLVFPRYPVFQKNELLKFLLLRFVCKDARRWGRNGGKVQMFQIYLPQNTVLALKKNAFSSNLEGEGKQKFLSVPTMLEYSYQFKNILIGYAFSNISKIISLYLRPQFYYTFCAGFLYQKMLYIMLQRNIHYIQIISFVR